MMTFIIMTLSFTVAILLAGAVSVYILMQPKVLKWYMKRAVKMMDHYDTVFDELEEESK